MRHCQAIAKNIYLLKKKEISMRGLYITNISNRYYVLRFEITYYFSISRWANSIESKSKFVEQIYL